MQQYIHKIQTKSWHVVKQLPLFPGTASNQLSELFVNESIRIPLAEIEFSFARSGGPGGQNVNKVNSKAIMRWQVRSTSSLPYGVRVRFLAKFSSRLTSDGELIITSQRHRDQGANVDDCLEKLREMLESVATPPTPRRPTRPSLAAKQRRIESKNQTSIKKQQRRAPRTDD